MAAIQLNAQLVSNAVLGTVRCMYTHKKMQTECILMTHKCCKYEGMRITAHVKEVHTYRVFCWSGSHSDHYICAEYVWWKENLKK